MAPPTMNASDNIEKTVSSVDGLVAGGGTAKRALPLAIWRRGVNGFEWKQAVVVVHFPRNTFRDRQRRRLQCR